MDRIEENLMNLIVPINVALECLKKYKNYTKEQFAKLSPYEKFMLTLWVASYDMAMDTNYVKTLLDLTNNEIEITKIQLFKNGVKIDDAASFSELVKNQSEKDDGLTEKTLKYIRNWQNRKQYKLDYKLQRQRYILKDNNYVLID